MSSPIESRLDRALERAFGGLDVGDGFDARLQARLRREATSFDREQAQSRAAQRRAAALALERRWYRRSLGLIGALALAALTLLVLTAPLWVEAGRWILSAPATVGGLPTPTLVAFATVAAVGTWLWPRAGLRIE